MWFPLVSIELTLAPDSELSLSASDIHTACNVRRKQFAPSPIPLRPGYDCTNEAIDRVAAAPPLQNITLAHLPGGYDDYKPPLLHFGWSFDSKALLKWAAENGIDTTNRYRNSDGSVHEAHDSLAAATKPEALEVLASKAGTPELRVIYKIGMHLKDNMRSVTPERIDALDQYLKEHGLVKDSPAWHLDHELYKWKRLIRIQPDGYNVSGRAA
ncbi:hypothetical protein BJ322DRAFT_1111490 [Thelephora terrestris]|uniref:Uncharacterized protein n=1 Tax=Thelephora terrestris TaxID=56493 RepID=A0A9P6L3X4_9AGAM|nr:hypothetical protein BJ322DRAFT_1111490 [Thelephora terrestris]